MNFKTFCLSALALLSAVSAAPIENDASYVDKVKTACRLGSSELFYKMNGDESTTYACIHKFNPQRMNNVATPDNSACYYYNDDVYCVDRRYTSIKECDESNENFDYRACSLRILSLKDENDSNMTSKFRTYPEKERILIDAIQDQKDCRARGGIVLTYNVVYQYICLYPETARHSLEDKQCVDVDGKVYCVYEDNTIINTCNKHSKYYEHDRCIQDILEYGSVNGVNVSAIEGF